ncbi:hypothetical protein GH714_021574 [Hevea brasiliensis]|uniref:Uncharacterized protein n=1 Tax=Hevea brasiliensis TaxID=3981 RepID=A0A6A6KUQ0_HEVBR|nr:hypothetical protein GH714_021574 [Hevea brasiliensis]
MDRALDTDDDGGCFDRMIAAIKLLEETILTTFMQQVRAKAMSKHDDQLAAYVPKKSRGHGQRIDKKPHSQSSFFHHVKSSGSMNENKERVGGKRCFQSADKRFQFSYRDEEKLKEPKEKIQVTLMEPCGFESKMWLRQWNL